VRLSRVQRVLVSFAVAASVFLGGGVLDWLVAHQYLPRVALTLAGAVVASAVGTPFTPATSPSWVSCTIPRCLIIREETA
jgi:hypothetical protein